MKKLIAVLVLLVMMSCQRVHMSHPMDLQVVKDLDGNFYQLFGNGDYLPTDCYFLQPVDTTILQPKVKK